MLVASPEREAYEESLAELTAAIRAATEQRDNQEIRRLITKRSALISEKPAPPRAEAPPSKFADVNVDEYVRGFSLDSNCGGLFCDRKCGAEQTGGYIVRSEEVGQDQPPLYWGVCVKCGPRKGISPLNDPAGRTFALTADRVWPAYPQSLFPFHPFGPGAVALVATPDVEFISPEMKARVLGASEERFKRPVVLLHSAEKDGIQRSVRVMPGPFGEHQKVLAVASMVDDDLEAGDIDDEEGEEERGCYQVEVSKVSTDRSFIHHPLIPVMIEACVRAGAQVAVPTFKLAAATEKTLCPLSSYSYGEGTLPLRNLRMVDDPLGTTRVMLSPAVYSISEGVNSDTLANLANSSFWYSLVPDASSDRVPLSAAAQGLPVCTNPSRHLNLLTGEPVALFSATSELDDLFVPSTEIYGKGEMSASEGKRRIQPQYLQATDRLTREYTQASAVTVPVLAKVREGRLILPTKLTLVDKTRQQLIDEIAGAILTDDKRARYFGQDASLVTQGPSLNPRVGGNMSILEGQHDRSGGPEGMIVLSEKTFENTSFSFGAGRESSGYYLIDLTVPVDASGKIKSVEGEIAAAFPTTTRPSLGRGCKIDTL
jgi:hypothetical protein